MMVSSYDENRLLLILQVDHSKITGWFAAHWGNDNFAQPTPYTAMVLAAQEHDTGWWDWEIKPQVNSEGVPPDYIGFQVYPEVREFIAEQESYRKQLLEHLKNSEIYRDFVFDEQLSTNFKLMEVYDQMCQFVCNRYPFNSSARKNGPTNTLSNVPTPTKPGKEDTILTISIQDDSRATITPYPFDIDPLPVSFQARLVPKRRYGTQDEFLKEYYCGERLMIHYSLSSQ